ncbi:MAG: c-type cytochrome [Planctomycetota bacterium]|jgi:hypothetical protein
MRLLPLLLLAGAIAAAAGERRERRPRSVAPRALFQARCSACHDPGRVHHRRASRDEWREIVDRMRRMPQSGISPGDAEIILDYLVSLGGQVPAAREQRRGGRAAFAGREWLSILEIATVREERVRLGGVVYEVEPDEFELTLRPDKKVRHVVSLTEKGAVDRTALLDRWQVGRVAYELHLVLFEIRGETFRVARALKRLGRN